MRRDRARGRVRHSPVARRLRSPACRCAPLPASRHSGPGPSAHVSSRRAHYSRLESTTADVTYRPSHSPPRRLQYPRRERFPIELRPEVLANSYPPRADKSIVGPRFVVTIFFSTRCAEPIGGEAVGDARFVVTTLFSTRCAGRRTRTVAEPMSSSVVGSGPSK